MYTITMTINTLTSSNYFLYGSSGKPLRKHHNSNKLFLPTWTPTERSKYVETLGDTRNVSGHMISAQNISYYHKVRKYNYNSNNNNNNKISITNNVGYIKEDSWQLKTKCLILKLC